MSRHDVPSPHQELGKPSESVGDVSAEANFKKNVAQELREAQEKGELPPVELEFFFNRHATANDISSFPDTFSRNDILVTEGLDWEKKYLDQLNIISSGKFEREVLDIVIKMNKINGYEEKKWHTIHDSKKPIIINDVPKGHPLAKELINFHKNSNILDGDSFSGIISNFRRMSKREVELQKKREAYMLANLVPLLKKCLVGNPQLKTREKLKVLIQVGASHTSLYIDLKKQGINVTRSFNQMPYTFLSGATIDRSGGFGREVDDDLVARAILEYLIITQLQNRLGSAMVSPERKVRMMEYEKMDMFVMKLVAKLSLNDIKSIFDYCFDYKTRNMEWRKFFDIISEKFPKMWSQLNNWIDEIYK